MSAKKIKYKRNEVELHRYEVQQRKQFSARSAFEKSAHTTKSLTFYANYNPLVARKPRLRFIDSKGQKRNSRRREML